MYTIWHTVVCTLRLRKRWERYPEGKQETENVSEKQKTQARNRKRFGEKQKTWATNRKRCRSENRERRRSKHTHTHTHTHTLHSNKTRQRPLCVPSWSPLRAAQEEPVLSFRNMVFEVLYYLSGTPLCLLLFPCVSRRHFLFLANCFLLLFFCSSPKFSVSRRCFLFRRFLFLASVFCFSPALIGTGLATIGGCAS